MGGKAPQQRRLFFFVTKSIDFLWCVYGFSIELELLTPKFALGGVMPRSVSYDVTMLIRLSSELRTAFNAVCKAKGLTPSDEIRRLMLAHVTDSLAAKVEKAAKPSNAPERCEDTLDMFPAEEVEKPPVRPPVRPPARKKKKRR